MKVLIACEYSGRVRDAFLRHGHHAMSCDLLPTEVDGPHYEGPVEDVLYEGWDLMVAHPPCTHLSVSGARWFRSKGIQGLIDSLILVESCRKICEWYGCPWMIENPVGRLSTSWRKPDSTFQPWQYGDLYSKKTCIWHGGGFVFPRPQVDEEPGGVDQRIWRMPPSEDRADVRSATPLGFAKAVCEANQWVS